MSVASLWLSWTQTLLCFKAKCFGGSCLPGRVQGLGCLMWGTNPHSSGRSSVFVSSLLAMGHYTWVGFLARPSILLLLPDLMWPFYPCPEGAAQLAFRANCSMCSCSLSCSMCSWEEEVSSDFLRRLLEWPLFAFFKLEGEAQV